MGGISLVDSPPTYGVGLTRDRESQRRNPAIDEREAQRFSLFLPRSCKGRLRASAEGAAPPVPATDIKSSQIQAAVAKAKASGCDTAVRVVEAGGQRVGIEHDVALERRSAGAGSACNRDRGIPRARRVGDVR